MPPKSGSLGEFIAQVVRDAAPDALSLDEVLLRVANAGFESSITRPKDTKNNATSILKSNRGKLFHESMREGTDSAPPERVVPRPGRGCARYPGDAPWTLRPPQRHRPGRAPLPRRAPPDPVPSGAIAEPSAPPIGPSESASPEGVPDGRRGRGEAREGPSHGGGFGDRDRDRTRPLPTPGSGGRPPRTRPRRTTPRARRGRRATAPRRCREAAEAPREGEAARGGGGASAAREKRPGRRRPAPPARSPARAAPPRVRDPTRARRGGGALRRAPADARGVAGEHAHGPAQSLAAPRPGLVSRARAGNVRAGVRVRARAGGGGGGPTQAPPGLTEGGRRAFAGATCERTAVFLCAVEERGGGEKPAAVKNQTTRCWRRARDVRAPAVAGAPTRRGGRFARRRWTRALFGGKLPAQMRVAPRPPRREHLRPRGLEGVGSAASGGSGPRSGNASRRGGRGAPWCCWTGGTRRRSRRSSRGRRSTLEGEGSDAAGGVRFGRSVA